MTIHTKMPVMLAWLWCSEGRLQMFHFFFVDSGGVVERCDDTCMTNTERKHKLPCWHMRHENTTRYMVHGDWLVGDLLFYRPVDGIEWGVVTKWQSVLHLTKKTVSMLYGKKSEWITPYEHPPSQLDKTFFISETHTHRINLLVTLGMWSEALLLLEYFQHCNTTTTSTCCTLTHIVSATRNSTNTLRYQSRRDVDIVLIFHLHHWNSW